MSIAKQKSGSTELRCAGVVGNEVRAHVTACGTYMVIDLPNFICGLSLDFPTARALHQAIGSLLPEMAQPDPNDPGQLRAKPVAL